MATVALSPLRLYATFSTSSLVGYCIFFLLTFASAKTIGTKLPVWSKAASIFAGLLSLQLPLRFQDFEGSLVSLPEAIVHSIGILCGFLFVSFTTRSRYVVAGFGFLLALFMFFQGYAFWLHKLNFGTFRGRTEYALAFPFVGVSEQGRIVSHEEFSKRITLLDFWHTRCGVCFAKFPKLQELYDKYKDDPMVAIYAVNKPLDEDGPDQAFRLIREKGYSFPVVLPKDKELPEKWGVKYYPTTFIIDQNRGVVFKGGIDMAIDVLDELRSTSK
ncbi:MAG: TlpA family protein disulfide reductase [Pyrinomonadaceae bacterium]